jgi:hypothetical protein
MSRIDETTNPISAEGQLDRLVDGELNETDRRELLLQFEREPEGWRRCALAFLEAQCWKQELGLMRRSPEAAATEAAPVSADAVTVRKASSGRAPWRQHLATALTMGACFLIALFIGLNFRGINTGPAHGPENSSAVATKADAPLNGAQSAEEVVEIDRADGKSESLHIPRARHEVPVQNVAEQGPDAIPPAVKEAFQRSGHEVVQERQVVPVQMNNGRQLMVPVDHVQIHYVGRGSL